MPFKAGNVLLFLFAMFFVPLLCQAEVSWTSELRGGAVVFTQEEFEDVFDQEAFPMVRYILGVQLVKNLEINGSIGGMYMEGEAKGTETGERSEEEFEFWIVPAQLNIGYRFDFADEQFLVPWVFAGGDYWFFSEQSDFHDDVKGDKLGYHASAGFDLLLDALEPPAAARMEKLWGVTDTYASFSAEWSRIGYDDDGIDFSNMQYSVGIMFKY